MKLTRRSVLATLAAGMPKLFAQQRSEAPNVIIIIADDLGYGELGSYGNTLVPTPATDRLAREGVRFTNAYTPSSVCSPTRYGLLTGRYCWRTSLQRQVVAVRGSLHIETARPNLASLFKKHGYATAAIGKWHLGYGSEARLDDWNKPLKPGPLEIGFDYHFGVPSNHNDAVPGYIVDHALVGPTRIHDRTSLTLAEEAVQFIERSVKTPFFLYFTPVAVHNAITPNKRFRGKSRAGLYGDFIAELDFSVELVLAALDRLKLRDNTIVVFTSDNGAVIADGQPWREFRLNLENDDNSEVSTHYRYAKAAAEAAGLRSVGDLRGGKWSIYEGGFKVPFIVRWPKRVTPGRVSAEVVSLVDMMATFSSLLGEELMPGSAEDSYNILPAVLGEKFGRPIREAVVLHNAEGVFAIRQGDWKLIEARDFPEQARDSRWAKEGTNQLYNLKDDPREERNVWHQYPEVVRRLTALLTDYRRRGASRPL